MSCSISPYRCEAIGLRRSRSSSTAAAVRAAGACSTAGEAGVRGADEDRTRRRHAHRGAVDALRGVSRMTVAIPAKPLLTPWYRLVGDGDRLLLEHGQVVVVLEGAAVAALLPALLPLLDGSRTVPELVERLGVAAAPAVERALETLAMHGLLVEGPPAPAGVRPTAHALAAAHGLTPAVAADRLSRARIGFVGGGVAAADAARLLHFGGVGHVHRVSWRRGAEVDLAVVAPAADELDGLLAWNDLAFR